MGGGTAFSGSMTAQKTMSMSDKPSKVWASVYVALSTDEAFDRLSQAKYVAIISDGAPYGQRARLPPLTRSWPEVRFWRLTGSRWWVCRPRGEHVRMAPRGGDLCTSGRRGQSNHGGAVYWNFNAIISAVRRPLGRASQRSFEHYHNGRLAWQMDSAGRLHQESSQRVR